MDPPLRANPSQSRPLHRHQSSLEGILDFSTESSLSADQRARSSQQFYYIVHHFESPVEKKPYSRPLLVRYTYEYARSQESSDAFLRAFSRSMRLSCLACRRRKADGRARSGSHSSALTHQGESWRSLAKDPPREAALAILNMFDMDVAHLINGPDIDRPRNALTLTHQLHQLFSEFHIFFEATDQPYTYRIGTFLPRHLIRDPPLPITRTLFLAESRAIDLPLPRLLAVHYAIAHILHLSAAGGYIDQILWDAEEHGVRADGSTDLGRLIHLGLRSKLTSG